MKEYPRYKYHAIFGSCVVRNEFEDGSLEDHWKDLPGEAGNIKEISYHEAFHKSKNIAKAEKIEQEIKAIEEEIEELKEEGGENAPKRRGRPPKAEQNDNGS